MTVLPALRIRLWRSTHLESGGLLLGVGPRQRVKGAADTLALTPLAPASLTPYPPHPAYAGGGGAPSRVSFR